MTQKINADSPTPKKTNLVVQQPNTPVDSKLVDANTKFGFKLFQEVLKQEIKKSEAIVKEIRHNTLASPLEERLRAINPNQ